MAANHNFTIEHKFNSPFANIYDVVLDFTKFGHFHPHMKTVKIVSKNKPNEIEYEVDEEVLLYGFIRLRPNYKATVLEIEKNKHVRYLSQVKKNIFLTIDFTFSEDKDTGNTKIIEKVDVKGNKFIATVFLSLLKKAHLQMFQNFNSN
ncbi:MAG: hypothetical protein Q8L81_14975 [Bacteroidota bacterium]|nr:hypothetical protein [Bacteroidota bacterium]